MQGQMPSMTLPAMQMPTPGYQPYPPMKNDCGCGGPKPFHHLGGYGVQPGYHPSQMMQGGYHPSQMMQGGYPMQQPAHMGMVFQPMDQCKEWDRILEIHIGM